MNRTRVNRSAGRYTIWAWWKFAKSAAAPSPPEFRTTDTMSPQASFSEAVENFRQFLTAQGHNGPLVWITPSDVALLQTVELLISPKPEGESEAEKLFMEASDRNVGVLLQAFARLDHCICCFVFEPKAAEEASSQFIRPPVTMKIREPLSVARRAGMIRWRLRQAMSSRRDRERALSFFGYDRGAYARPFTLVKHE
jgi:hypothetical protein